MTSIETPGFGGWYSAIILYTYAPENSNVAPVLAGIGDKIINEGSELTFDATATDDDIPANALTFSVDAGAPVGATINPTTGVFSWTPANGPAQSQAITIRVTDNGSPALSDFETINVTVNNVSPVIGTITAPLAPIAVATNATVTWNFTDPGADTWTCSIDWDTGVGFTPASYVAPKSCSAITTLIPGLYTVTVKVDDGDGGVDSETLTTDIVVYDPNGGFVTGSGWINSPAGAFLDAANAPAGKATFSFVSKYVQPKSLPTGNTEFKFHAAGMEFKSTSYEWLVVDSMTAQFKGVGTINGAAGYAIMLTAIEGGNTSAGVNPDKFRIKIWKVGNSNEVVYDNQRGADDDSKSGTFLSGGSIVIHKK